MQTKTSPKMDKIFGNIINTIIAAGVVWMATEINKLDSNVSAIQEKTKSFEDIHPSIDQLRLSQEEIKERLIRVEDNQHHKIIQQN